MSRHTEEKDRPFQCTEPGCCRGFAQKGGLEKHLDAKYPGTKRFGLEGGESLIPALDELIQRS